MYLTYKKLLYMIIILLIYRFTIFLLFKMESADFSNKKKQNNNKNYKLYNTINNGKFIVRDRLEKEIPSGCAGF